MLVLVVVLVCCVLCIGVGGGGVVYWWRAGRAGGRGKERRGAWFDGSTTNVFMHTGRKEELVGSAG